MKEENILMRLEEIPGGAEIMLYGAGEGGKAVRRSIEASRKDVYIAGFIDTFKIGVLDNLKIFSLEEAKDSGRFDFILVTSNFWPEIVGKLESLGIDNYKIYTNNFNVYHTYAYELFDNGSYEELKPSCTYAPWNDDESFQKTYRMIRNHTFVDKYRCYELWTLVDQVKHLEGAMIEIGVWKGGTGALLAKKAELSGFKDNVYLCDTFNGIVKAGEKDNHYRGGEHSDTSAEIVRSLVEDVFQLKNVRILKGVFPDETAHLIDDKRFRLCHIDVDVYQSSKEIVDWIWDKMPIGGVIVFDDYGYCGCTGVTKYVEERMNDRDKLVVHNLNGHALIIKTTNAPPAL